MPKETFFNLPEAKRTHITNVAIDEFANHDYGTVSISRIVSRAGIAKGSFYQYFEDKEDLHGYLLDLAMQRKWEVLALDHPDPQHIGIFRYLLWTAQASVQIQLLYPDLTKVAYRALTRNSYPEGFMAHAQQESHKFFVRLVQIGKEQGDLHPEIDEDLAAFMFTTVLTNMGQFLLPRIVMSKAYRPGEENSEENFFVPEVMQIFQQVINILEHGMGKPQTVGEGDRISQGQEVVDERTK